MLTPFHHRPEFVGLLLLAATACDTTATTVNALEAGSDAATPAGDDGGTGTGLSSPPRADGGDLTPGPDASDAALPAITQDATLAPPDQTESDAEGIPDGIGDAGLATNTAAPSEEPTSAPVSDTAAPPVIDAGPVGILFEDDFDGETLATNDEYTFNYTGFAQWEVIGGTVDITVLPNEFLASPGGYGDGQPASGVTVDLNGSNLHRGVLETNVEFVFLAGATYELSYTLGSPVAESNSARVEVVGVFSRDEQQDGIAPFSAYTATFTPEQTTTARLRFTGLGQDDNVGLFLDRVRLERLP